MPSAPQVPLPGVGFDEFFGLGGTFAAIEAFFFLRLTGDLGFKVIDTVEQSAFLTVDTELETLVVLAQTDELVVVALEFGDAFLKLFLFFLPLAAARRNGSADTPAEAFGKGVEYVLTLSLYVETLSYKIGLGLIEDFYYGIENIGRKSLIGYGCRLGRRRAVTRRLLLIGAEAAAMGTAGVCLLTA